MKRPNLLSSFCIATVALSLFALSAHGQILNGGFEAGDFTGWDVSNTSPFANNIGSDPSFSHSGTFHANLAGDPGPDTLSQTFNTTDGETYTLSFWLAHDITGSADNTFEVFWNGAPVMSLANLGLQDYVQYTFDLAATGSSTTLEFRYQDNDDFFRLDDVSVSVVPEPSTTSFAIFGLGLVGVACYGRAKLRGASSAV